MNSDPLRPVPPPNGDQPPEAPKSKPESPIPPTLWQKVKILFGSGEEVPGGGFEATESPGPDSAKTQRVAGFQAGAVLTDEQKTELETFLKQYQKVCQDLREGEKGHINVNWIFAHLAAFKNVLGVLYQESVQIDASEKERKETLGIEENMVADRENFLKMSKQPSMASLAPSAYLRQQYGIGEKEIIDLDFMKIRIPQILRGMVDFNQASKTDNKFFQEYFSQIDPNLAKLLTLQQDVKKTSGNSKKLESIAKFLEMNRGNLESFFSYQPKLFNFREFLMTRLKQLDLHEDIFDPKYKKQDDPFYLARRDLEKEFTQFAASVSRPPTKKEKELLFLAQKQIVAAYLEELTAKLNPDGADYQKHLELFDRLHFSLTDTFLFAEEVEGATEMPELDLFNFDVALLSTAQEAQQAGKNVVEAEKSLVQIEEDLEALVETADSKVWDRNFAATELNGRNTSETEIESKLRFISEDPTNVRGRLTDAQTKVRTLEAQIRGEESLAIQDLRQAYDLVTDKVRTRSDKYIRARQSKSQQERKSTGAAKELKLAEKNKEQRKQRVLDLQARLEALQAELPEKEQASKQAQDRFTEMETLLTQYRSLDLSEQTPEKKEQIERLKLELPRDKSQQKIIIDAYEEAKSRTSELLALLEKAKANTLVSHQRKYNEQLAVLSESETVETQALKDLEAAQQEQAEAQEKLDTARAQVIQISSPEDVQARQQADLKAAQVEVKTLIEEARVLIRTQTEAKKAKLDDEIGEIERQQAVLSSKQEEQTTAIAQTRKKAEATFLAVMPALLDRLMFPAQMAKDDASIEALFACLPLPDKRKVDKAIDIARILPVFLTRCCQRSIDDLALIPQTVIDLNFSQHKIRQILQYAYNLALTPRAEIR